MTDDKYIFTFFPFSVQHLSVLQAAMRMHIWNSTQTHWDILLLLATMIFLSGPRLLEFPRNTDKHIVLLSLCYALSISFQVLRLRCLSSCEHNDRIQLLFSNYLLTYLLGIITTQHLTISQVWAVYAEAHFHKFGNAPEVSVDFDVSDEPQPPVRLAVEYSSLKSVFLFFIREFPEVFYFSLSGCHCCHCSRQSCFAFTQGGCVN